MNKITIIDTSSDTIHQYGMCGYKDLKNPGYKKKVEWVKHRFEEGMRYKILHSEDKGAIGAIEYIPGEFAWRPVQANGFMFIHCIFIIPKKYKEQGYGKKLIEACIEDAKNAGMQGVAVVCRKGTWMASKDIFIRSGFEVADNAPPDFELLVFKFNKSSENPSFNKTSLSEKYKKGLHMIAGDQCPYIEKARVDISEAASKDFNLELNITELKTGRDAQKSPCSFGTFCLIYNGKIIADHPVSKSRFGNIMRKEIRSWMISD